MAKQILKAELAAQNSALRAELSQAKADLAAAQQGFEATLRAALAAQAAKFERSSTPLQHKVAAKKALSRAELMAQAKAVAKAKGCTTKILDGQVLYHDGANWQVAA